MTAPRIPGTAANEGLKTEPNLPETAAGTKRGSATILVVPRGTSLTDVAPVADFVLTLGTDPGIVHASRCEYARVRVRHEGSTVLAFGHFISGPYWKECILVLSKSRWDTEPDTSPIRTDLSHSGVQSQTEHRLADSSWSPAHSGHCFLL